MNRSTLDDDLLLQNMINSRQPVSGYTRKPAAVAKRDTGLVLSHGAAFGIWAILWLLNGLSTVAPFALFGAQIGAVGVLAGLGLCWHLGTSLIEHHLWKAHDRATYPLIFLVGLQDVATASLALLFVGHVLHIDVYNLTAYSIIVLIAETIAIASEPMLVRHWRHLRKLTR